MAITISNNFTNNLIFLKGYRRLSIHNNDPGLLTKLDIFKENKIKFLTGTLKKLGDYCNVNL